MKNICFVLMLFLILSSCTEDNSELGLLDKNYFIFGHTYGECEGEECVETFLISKGKIYEDVLDIYTKTEYDFIALQNGSMEELIQLPSLLPNELINSDQETFGCPDCLDQGAIYIERSINGKKEHWWIDQDKNAIPAYLWPFANKVNQAIASINREEHFSAFCDQSLIIDNERYASQSLDSFTISDVTLTEHCLEITYGASGCDGNFWHIELVDSGGIMESLPVQRDLRLKFTNNESCLAVFSKTTSFDLSPAMLENEEAILFNLEGWDEQIRLDY